MTLNGNMQAVGLSGNDIVVMMPKQRMTKAEAIEHAAWLVALADDEGNFLSVLREVMET